MHPKNVRTSVLTALLIACLVACSQQRAEHAAAAADAEMKAAPRDMPAPAEPAGAARTEGTRNAPANVTATVPVAGQLTSATVNGADAQRQFIRTAHAQFRVKDVYTSALAIEDIVAAHGGFVVRNDIGAETLSTQRRARGDGRLVELTEYVTRGSLIVRVPSDKTQAFLLAIVGQIDFLDHRTFEATDAQFDMLRQQLAFERGQEGQRDIGQAEQQGGRLDQRTDAIQLRDQARAGRDEALVAQKEFEDRVAFSTIELSMYQPPNIRATEMVDAQAEFERNSPGFPERFGHALGKGWYGLLDAVVGLASVWPLWVVLFGVLAVVRHVARRRVRAGTPAA
jgi:hypothetical protein